MQVPHRAWLTAAELRLVTALADGLTLREVAERDNLSLNTIQNRAGDVRRKLQARTTTQACCIAVREGWLE